MKNIELTQKLEEVGNLKFELTDRDEMESGDLSAGNLEEIVLALEERIQVDGKYYFSIFDLFNMQEISLKYEKSKVKYKAEFEMRTLELENKVSEHLLENLL